MSGAARSVAVIGGGIAGLAAAHRLTAEGDVDVTLFEADATVGGKLRTSPFAGHPAVDEGPDAFLARVPWATALALEVGLGDELVSPASGSAAVWWHRLHPIPGGLLLGLPTGVRSLARSRLLTWSGKVRAATEPFRRRTPLDADSLGAFVRARFGDEVHERLVDPLVGSIYAADTDRFSLAAVPQIAELAGRSRSILLGARHTPSPPADAGPVFFAPRGGMGAFATAVLRAAESRGLQVHHGVVRSVEPDGHRWRVDDRPFDAVVVATPPAATAGLLATAAPAAADLVARIPSADVAMITLAIRKSDWPAHLRDMSGYLVPKPVQRTVTAASFGSQKWPHWAVPGHVVLRVSLGRDALPVLDQSDERLLGTAVDEVGHHLGLGLQPDHARVSRWEGAFPQYRPHHAALVAEIEAALPPGLGVAGAGYHGIGVPACVRSGQNASTRTLEHLRAVAE